MPKALPPPKADAEPNALVEGPVATGLAPKGLAAGAAGVPKALVAGGVEPKALVVGAVVPKALVGAGVAVDGAVAVPPGEAVVAAAGVDPKDEPLPKADPPAGFPKALWPNADCGCEVWPNADCPNALVAGWAEAAAGVPNAEGVLVVPMALPLLGEPNAVVEAAGVLGVPKALVAVLLPKALVAAGVEVLLVPNALGAAGVLPKALVPAGLAPNAPVDALCPKLDCPKPDWPNPDPGAGVVVAAGDDCCPKAEPEEGVCPNALVPNALPAGLAPNALVPNAEPPV